MRFLPSMPAVHNFLPEISEKPAWYQRWGWCNLAEVVQQIENAYNFHWNTPYFLTRFVPMGDGKDFSLIFLFHLDFGRFEAKRRQEIATFGELVPENTYVPAGWVKKVFFSLQNGATGHVNNQDELWAVNDEMKLILCWSGGH